MENPEKTLTVTEYIGAVNIALNRFKVKITGEVTQVTIATSGQRGDKGGQPPFLL